MSVAVVLGAGATQGLRSRLLAHSVETLRGVPSIARVHVAGADLRALVDRAIADWGPDTAVVLHDPSCSPVDPSVVDQALATLEAGGCTAIVAAAPVVDTLKRSGPDGDIERSLDRNSFWEIRTPQVFRAGPLRDALQGAEADAVDEALRVGDHGLLPALVLGEVRVVALAREAFRAEADEDGPLIDQLLSLVARPSA